MRGVRKQCKVVSQNFSISVFHIHSYMASIVVAHISVKSKVTWLFLRWYNLSLWIIWNGCTHDFENAFDVLVLWIPLIFQTTSMSHIQTFSVFTSESLFPGFGPTTCTGTACSKPKRGKIYFFVLPQIIKVWEGSGCGTVKTSRLWLF